MKIGQKFVFKDGNIYTIEKINDIDNTLFQIKEEKRAFKTWFGEDFIDYKKSIIRELRDIKCSECPILNCHHDRCSLSNLLHYLEELYK